MFTRLLVLTLLGPMAFAATVRIDSDGMAIVDGERTFILGLYETPEEDGLVEQIANAGFNLVRAPANPKTLDKFHEAGLWAWLVTGNAIDLSEDTAEREKMLRVLVEALGAHPALAIWEVPDEALWNAWYLAEQWREIHEPAMLEDRIAQLEDKARAEDYRQQWRQVQEWRRIGDFAQAEALADALWEQLGEASPQAGFGLTNAPERAERMAEGFLEGYRLLKRLDPLHPVWMNHAPRNSLEDLARFNEAADIVGCDIYPVPEALDVRHSDLADRTLSSVGAYTARMQAAAPGKPVWMVLQGAGWGDFLENVDDERRAALRRPTREETRFMAYNAIVRGARGLLYWGTFYVEKDSAFWKELCGVVHELHTLQPVLSAPDAPLPLTVTHAPTHGSTDRGIHALAKDAPSGTWFLVVNEWTAPLTAIIGGLESLEGAHYQDTETGRKFTVEGGALRIPMPRQSVLVLKPRQD